jgi:antirestriction protein
MDQNLYNIAVAAISAAIGWIVKVIWDAVRTLEQDIRDMERDLHVNYVSKDDYRQDILDLKDMVKQIFDKLDRKADK